MSVFIIDDESGLHQEARKVAWTLSSWKALLPIICTMVMKTLGMPT